MEYVLAAYTAGYTISFESTPAMVVLGFSRTGTKMEATVDLAGIFGYVRASAASETPLGFLFVLEKEATGC
jgi:hypothetical protein